MPPDALVEAQVVELPRPKGEVVLLAARLGIGDEVDGTERICQAQAGLRGEPAQGRERGRAPGRIGSSCACTAGYRASGRPKRRRSSVTILRVARRPTPDARSSTAPDDYANSHPNSKRSRFNNSGTTPLNRTRKRPIRAL